MTLLLNWQLYLLSCSGQYQTLTDIHTAAVKVILEDNKEGVVEKVVTVGNRVELKCRGDGTGQQV